MALSPVLPYKLPELGRLIYVKTNIGGWFFDAFLKIDHSSRLTITEHPIQTGASIADYAYLNPQQLTFDIGMSDVAQSLVPDQFTQGWSRSVTAYQVLKELQKNRVPLQVNTRLGVYKNMLIESIDTSDNYQTQYGLKATVVLRELFIAQVTTVKISARPQVTGSTNKGKVEPVAPNQSILYQLFSANGGK